MLGCFWLAPARVLKKVTVKVGDQSLITYNYQSDKSKIDSVVYGDGSQINYTYNPYGQEYTKTTSLGTVTTKYDALGTLVYQKDVPGGIKTYYKYDEDGRLYGEKVATTDVNNSLENFLYSSHNAFDENGNITKNTVASSVRSYPTRYTYDENGLLTNLRVSSSRQKAYTYDEEDRLTGTSMSTATPVADSFTYNEQGLIATHTLDGVVYTYTYDDNGNITEIKKGTEVAQSYEYDGNNQLVRVNDKELDKTVVYEYDSYGNILSKKECSYTEVDVNSIVGTTVSYTYDENWKDKLTSYNGQSITYDEIGNPEIYMGAEIEWFARQMQSYITDTLKITYKYDTDGLRTQKVVNGVEHNYYYVDGLLRIEEIKGSYTLNYRYDDRGVLTAVSSYNVNTGAVNILYAMTNTRGDVVALYDGDGDIRTRYTYDAWGKLVSVTDGDGNALGANKLGSLNSIRYRGYVYDTETGLYYLQSRYYDPEVGRFLNADSVDFIGYSGEALSYNIFAYCKNEPVNRTDSLGYLAIELGAKFLSTALFFVAAVAICSVVLNTYLTSYSFQNQLSKDYNKLQSPVLSTQGKINLLNKLIKTFTRITVRFIKKSITVALAEAKIKKTVTRDSKTRYWTATVKVGYVDIGRGLTKNQAIKEVAAGRSVFAVTQYEAKAVALAAGGRVGKNNKALYPEIDKGKENTPGYYYHYHTYNRKGGHVYYLF